MTPSTPGSNATSNLLKYPSERRVRARGLHDFPRNRRSCRLGALTGRLFQQAARFCSHRGPAKQVQVVVPEGHTTRQYEI